MNIVFLSPHYDDAIYSCGATIYDLVQHGHDVTIWTLMAGIPTLPLPDTPVLVDNHQRWQMGENPVLMRRQEDTTASQIVGATTRYSDVLDCIYRTADAEALYPTENSLWEHIHTDDPAVKQLQHLSIQDIDQLYAPLGVGAHVDHLIVRNWGWQLAQTQPYPVQFYVEYPYLRNRVAVDKAIAQHPASLTLSHCSVSESAMQHKIEAMTAYQSQISSFWADETQIEREVRQTFSYQGAYAEKFAQLAE